MATGQRRWTMDNGAARQKLISEVQSETRGRAQQNLSFNRNRQKKVAQLFLIKTKKILLRKNRIIVKKFYKLTLRQQKANRWKYTAINSEILEKIFMFFKKLTSLKKKFFLLPSGLSALM